MITWEAKSGPQPQWKLGGKKTSLPWEKTINVRAEYWVDSDK